MALTAATVASGPSTRGRVYAVLGPTNTGKTHLAVERLLGHHSGVIGLPLRLLAREIYDRIVRAHGAGRVALVTGEEKIVPANPRWFVCTVESMPLERDVEFVAVDEIQLCADPERGHVFTDRLLRARGTAETMFLGAETVKGLVRRLVPEAEFVARPRFSKLACAGPRKLSRLPPRTAIVAFSADDVYAIAEHVRRQRGGAAVVMGALSPRTRNAQVALYQDGAVDFMVATDAIGMGLNMDIDHVAFAATRKFDGVGPRPLSAAELGQIAGRAGRHMNDGSFGTTGEVPPLEPELVERIENHRFDPVTAARWRNPALDFRALALLLRSLERPPPAEQFARGRDADDYLALAALAEDAEVRALADNPESLRLLWQVCQIPDFRKTMHEQHTRLLGQIFRLLAGPKARLPTDWVAAQMAGLDRTEGDIDTLAMRIAHIRTWTYVAHRPDWLDDARHWQERARAIEDRLSDALHAGLTQRFVDRRSAALVRSLKDRLQLLAQIGDQGEVYVEGQFVGTIEGLSFRPDATTTGPEGRHLRAAANRALGPALEGQAARLLAAPDAAFDLAPDGRVTWAGAAIAQLAAGESALGPRLQLLASERLAETSRVRARRRVEDWLTARIDAELAPLHRLAAAELPGAARGLAFQLIEGLGAVPRAAVQDLLRDLDRIGRGRLRSLGVKIGAAHLFLPSLLKPAPARLKCLLWSVRHGMAPMAPPTPGLTSFAIDAERPEGWWRAAGFAAIGGRAVRIDMLERVADRARRMSVAGAFAAPPELLSLLGCSRDELAPVLAFLGYRARRQGETELWQAARDGAAKARRRRKARGDAASPFARLRELGLG